MLLPFLGLEVQLEYLNNLYYNGLFIGSSTHVPFRHVKLRNSVFSILLECNFKSDHHNLICRHGHGFLFLISDSLTKFIISNHYYNSFFLHLSSVKFSLSGLVVESLRWKSSILTIYTTMDPLLITFDRKNTYTKQRVVVWPLVIVTI